MNIIYSYEKSTPQIIQTTKKAHILPNQSIFKYKINLKTH